jgi:putative redox protein
MSDVAGETIVVDETGKGDFQVEVKAGTSSFLMDEPVQAGGLGSGPNPYDLLSAAIGACALMTIRLYRVDCSDCQRGAVARERRDF